MVSPEIYLLKALCSNRQLYHRYRRFIKTDNLEVRELTELYKTLDKYYESNQSKDHININDFIVLVNTYYHGDVYRTLSDLLLSFEINEDILTTVLEQLHDRAVAREVALAALDVSEGRSSREKLLEIVSQFESSPKKEEEKNIFVTSNLEELYNGTIKTPGLRWRLGTLNQMLGSLRKGDFGFIFARPETGKTTFLASEVTHFAPQASGPILWFNNEEQGSKVMTRCYQAALGVTTQQLFKDIDGNRQRYEAATRDRIKIFDSANINKSEVERLCRDLQPALIIFDQIDKIKGFDADREDLKLGAIYQWARELAKTYAPVIGVTQADGSGEGKKWLTMENVSNAKTAKQAEADWILGIGKTHEDGFELVRFLHLSKNKLSGDEDSVPELRHGKMNVLIKADIGRYEDI